MKNNSLTTEKLKKKFQNNFDLANFAIAIARSYVIEHEGGSLNDIIAEVKKQISESEST